jgi:(E)-4-hydroxy-3-methylbut-2-enyl-diphosphate synthase
MQIKRHKTRTVKVGNVPIGGNNQVAIQSMAKTKTSRVEDTLAQIGRLQTAGCEIVRLAIKDKEDARALGKIKSSVRLPLVADIHFDWRLAIAAIENGADKIRLNPGNIYKKEEIKEIVAALKSARIPLRVGLNSGSVKELNSRRHTLPVGINSHRQSMPDRLVAAALNYLRAIEDLGFHDIVVSLKASSVLDTVEAYRKIAKSCDYPLHLGVTATGLPFEGAIKSSIAIGALLLEGIGDTIRISLTDKPEEEVKVAKAILEALRIRNFGPEIISCPTCGRCEVDMVGIVKGLEDKIYRMNQGQIRRGLKVAVMGCVVNGPGEAKEADLGVAFGKKDGLIFKHGKAFKKVSFQECADVLLKEIEKS